MGANRAPIDDVRVDKCSSGRTGWLIAEYLYRMGHNVICIAGKTSANPTFPIPNVYRDGSPDGMLALCTQVAKDTQPDVWIHAAAVLDYFRKQRKERKPSGQDNGQLTLHPGRKHIAELSGLVGDSIVLSPN